MKYFGAGLSESHKELNRIIRKPELIEQTKELFLEIHGKLHLSVVSGNERNEVDELVGDLREDEYAIMPTAKDETIAWVLWHISRIEIEDKIGHKNYDEVIHRDDLVILG